MRTEHGELPFGILRGMAAFFSGLAVLLLVGCDSSEKINSARPVDSEVSERWASLLELRQDTDERAPLEREYQNRLRARALSCSDGYEPWFFTSREAVRERLTDTECFERTDQELVDWISAEALRALATLPALRPLPDEAPELIVTSNLFTSANFARDAGVVVISGYGQPTEIVDVATSDTIYLDDPQQGATYPVTISPNGRLFATKDTERGGIELRDATTGNTLATFPDYERIQWLDSELLLASGGRNKLTAIDLRTGKNSPVKGVTEGNFVRVKRGDRETYIGMSGYTLLELQVRREASGVSARLVRELPMFGVVPRAEPAFNGGRVVMPTANGLVVLDLATFAKRTIPLDPFYVQSVVPLPDPEQFLVNLRVPQARSFENRFAVYLPKEDKLALATGPMFETQNALAGRGVYFIPSLNRLAVQGAKSLTLLDEVTMGPRMNPEAFVALNRAEEAAAAVAPGLPLPGMSQSVGPVDGAAGTRPALSSPAVGPIPQLAVGAQIEAVGVYESATGNRGFGESKPAPVQVVLRRTSKPVILVLSSYEPVIWRVSSTAGASVRAVLLAGYNDSTVEGVGNARVIRIGRMHAYSRDSSGYTQLQQEVVRWTGRQIDTFQGTYKAASFVVGGN